MQWLFLVYFQTQTQTQIFKYALCIQKCSCLIPSFCQYQWSISNCRYNNSVLFSSKHVCPSPCSLLCPYWLISPVDVIVSRQDSRLLSSLKWQWCCWAWEHRSSWGVWLKYLCAHISYTLHQQTGKMLEWSGVFKKVFPRGFHFICSKLVL